MTTPVTLAQIVSAMNEMSTQQLTDLNKTLIRIHKAKRQVNAVVAAATFQIGQIVKFNGKSKGMRTIKIKGFNRAGTCLVGFEVNPVTKEVSESQWTVSPAICTLVQG